MADFAIRHEGMGEDQMAWVLEVVGDRLLLAKADGELYFRDVRECKLVGIMRPDLPRPVMIMQPGPPQSGLALPEPNRAMRRNLSLN